MLLHLLFFVIPFVVRCLSYDGCMDEFSWYPFDSQMTDFFSYYKSLFFVLGTICAVILFWYEGRLTNRKKQEFARKKGQFILKREKGFLDRKQRNSILWMLLIGYAVCIICSTLFSQDIKTSIQGNFGRFEAGPVLLAYCVCIYLSYRYSKKDGWVSRLFFLGTSAALIQSVIGILQWSGHDPFLSETIQRFLIPKSYQAEYIGNIQSVLDGNRAYGTLANPNYASLFYAMAFVVCLAYGYTSQKKTVKIFGYLSAFLDFIALILTGSRTGLFSLCFAAVTGGLIYGRKKGAKWIGKSLLCLLLGIFLFLAIDYLGGMTLTNRFYLTAQNLLVKPEKPPLTFIETGENEITITYRGNTIYLQDNMEEDLETGLRIYDKDRKEITGQFDLGILHEEGFESFYIGETEVEDERFLTVMIDDSIWYFTYVQDVGYMIYTGDGKYDQVGNPEHVDFHGYEKLASGRLYIWSRTLPLLKKYWLFGSGPDTFYLVFPQNDYVGKNNYAKTYLDIIEKPHNTYLLTAVQNGIPALIFLLLFGFFYYKQCIRLYQKTGPWNKEMFFGFAVFVIEMTAAFGGLFNDSGLNWSLFCLVMLGAGIGLNEHNQREGGIMNEKCEKTS